ncbi:uncharacterized protein LOC141494563 [Macrotis lagotis]|uniref:uncharacterized protein LOC141494563 n=1 Tax=Macrotis lagotis TaxID=92651 RepID=UPI003D69488C
MAWLKRTLGLGGRHFGASTQSKEPQLPKQDADKTPKTPLNAHAQWRMSKNLDTEWDLNDPSITMDEFKAQMVSRLDKLSQFQLSVFKSDLSDWNYLTGPRITEQDLESASTSSALANLLLMHLSKYRAPRFLFLVFLDMQRLDLAAEWAPYAISPFPNLEKAQVMSTLDKLTQAQLKLFKVYLIYWNYLMGFRITEQDLQSASTSSTLVDLLLKVYGKTGSRMLLIGKILERKRLDLVADWAPDPLSPTLDSFKTQVVNTLDKLTEAQLKQIKNHLIGWAYQMGERIKRLDLQLASTPSTLADLLLKAYSRTGTRWLLLFMNHDVNPMYLEAEEDSRSPTDNSKGTFFPVTAWPSYSKEELKNLDEVTEANLNELPFFKRHFGEESQIRDQNLEKASKTTSLGDQPPKSFGRTLTFWDFLRMFPPVTNMALDTNSEMNEPSTTMDEFKTQVVSRLDKLSQSQLRKFRSDLTDWNYTMEPRISEQDLVFAATSSSLADLLLMQLGKYRTPSFLLMVFLDMQRLDLVAEWVLHLASSIFTLEIAQVVNTLDKLTQAQLKLFKVYLIYWNYLTGIKITMQDLELASTSSTFADLLLNVYGKVGTRMLLLRKILESQHLDLVADWAPDPPSSTLESFKAQVESTLDKLTQAQLEMVKNYLIYWGYQMGGRIKRLDLQLASTSSTLADLLLKTYSRMGTRWLLLLAFNDLKRLDLASDWDPSSPNDNSEDTPCPDPAWPFYSKEELRKLDEVTEANLNKLPLFMRYFGEEYEIRNQDLEKISKTSALEDQPPKSYGGTLSFRDFLRIFPPVKNMALKTNSALNDPSTTMDEFKAQVVSRLNKLSQFQLIVFKSDLSDWNYLTGPRITEQELESAATSSTLANLLLMQLGKYRTPSFLLMVLLDMQRLDLAAEWAEDRIPSSFLTLESFKTQVVSTLDKLTQAQLKLFMVYLMYWNYLMGPRITEKDLESASTSATLADLLLKAYGKTGTRMLLFGNILESQRLDLVADWAPDPSSPTFENFKAQLMNTLDKLTQTQLELVKFYLTTWNYRMGCRIKSLDLHSASTSSTLVNLLLQGYSRTGIRLLLLLVFHDSKCLDLAADWGSSSPTDNSERPDMAWPFYSKEELRNLDEMTEAKLNKLMRHFGEESQIRDQELEKASEGSATEALWWDFDLLELCAFASTSEK